MRRSVAIAWRLAPVAATAMLLTGLALEPLEAQDTTLEGQEDQELEARPSEEATGFTPPMSGAPERRIGAGSRELVGSKSDPCADAEPGVDEAASEECEAKTDEASSEEDEGASAEASGEDTAGP